MSALPPKADIVERDRHVRFVPKADIGPKSLIDEDYVPHIVPRDDSSCEERWSEWQDLLFLCVTTDFLGLFSPALFVCVPVPNSSQAVSATGGLHTRILLRQQ